MEPEKFDFSDSWTAYVTIEAMLDVLYRAVDERNASAVNHMHGMIADAIAGVGRLIDRLGRGLGGRSLGASFPPDRWKDMSPREILLDLHNFVGVDQLAIDALRAKLPGSRTAAQKRLSNEIQSMQEKLRNKVFAAKAWIIKNSPGTWTRKEGENFKEWL